MDGMNGNETERIQLHQMQIVLSKVFLVSSRKSLMIEEKGPLTGSRRHFGPHGESGNIAKK
jgi:hypothetical protein